MQPVTEWSAGCVFQNPDPEVSDGRSAGRLVDETGGKALRRGDVTPASLVPVRTPTGNATGIPGFPQ